MAVDKRIEVELALRDTVSLTLKAIATNLEEMNKKLAKGGESASEGVDTFKKIKETTEGIRKTSEEGGKEATASGERMLPLVGMLGRMGPLAAIAVGVEVGRRLTSALGNLAQERLKLRAIHEDTGLTEGIISIFKQAQERLGITPDKGMANIEKFGSRLNEMATYGPGAAVFQQLHAIDEGALANTLLDLLKEGKGDEAAMAAVRRVDTLASGTAAQQQQALKIADAFKVGLSFFKGLEKEMEGLVPEYQVSIELAQRWMVDLTNVMVMGANVSKAVKNVGVIGENIAFDWLATIWDYFKTARGPLLGPKLIPPDQLEAFKERNKETLALLKQILNLFQNVENKQSIEKRWVGGPVLPGRTYEVAERGAEAFVSNAGWMEMLEPRGPRFFKPKTGGTIVPDTSQFEKGGLIDFERYRLDPKTGQFTERPSLPPGLGPEQNWEHLNKALTGPWGDIGIPEQYGGTYVPLLGSDTSAEELKSRERGMERRLRDDPDLYYGYEHGFRGETPERTSFRSEIDRELGSGGGSLGAQIIFNNVPEGVETNAEGEGFDNFTVNKTRQLGAI